MLPLLGIPLLFVVRKPLLFPYLSIGIFLTQAGLVYATRASSFEVEWLNIPVAANEYLTVKFSLVVNGLNILMLLLTYFVLTISVVVTPPEIPKPRMYYSLVLLLSFSLSGCFLVNDLFLFFLFFEAMLLPMFFLIGMWGGENRRYAALKFFLYTFAGSIFFLLALFPLAFNSVDWAATAKLSSMTVVDAMSAKNIPVVRSFDFGVLPQIRLSEPMAAFCFWAIFLAFAVKLPVVPFHTWLPVAHVEASAPVSVILAGILLKVGGYGLYRVCLGIFPEQMLVFGSILSAFALTSIIYGALNALAAKNLKTMIAYSSVTHMGYVLLGVVSAEATALNGVVLQLFNHGVVSAALFVIAGYFYERSGGYRMDNFGGVSKDFPKITFFSAVAFFAGLGLPGLNAFVSEALIFAGSFRSATVLSHFSVWIVVACLAGIVLTAAYFIRSFTGVFLGERSSYALLKTDANLRETFALSLLAAAMLVLGLWPAPALNLIKDDVFRFINALF